MSAAGSLSEPRVLARAKRRLFPEEDADGAYAVADTQFAAENWLADEPIPADVRETLAPFNHVRVGSGYPDLVGVRALGDDLLAVDRLGGDPPLIAIEAKGDTATGTASVERGVVQARDRLGEANAAYVAAPEGSISPSARSLAREVNVGVLAVGADGSVEPLERPRVVGNRTTTETDAIRFQASAQGVAGKSFPLNHPKNYLAVPLAVYHPDGTAALIEDRVVGAVDGARRGAAFLGLVEREPDRDRLTPLGREVVRFALREHGSVDAALDVVDGWRRSRERFCDLAPRWGSLARRVVWDYPATGLLVEELQNVHDDGIAAPTLPELVEYLHELHPSFAVELFVRGGDDARERVLAADGALRPAELDRGEAYHAPTVFQLKAMLYHAGILTERGAEPSTLDPGSDVWALRERL